MNMLLPLPYANDQLDTTSLYRKAKKARKPKYLKCSKITLLVEEIFMFPQGCVRAIVCVKSGRQREMKAKAVKNKELRKQVIKAYYLSLDVCRMQVHLVFSMEMQF